MIFVLLGLLSHALIRKLLSCHVWGKWESPSRIAAGASAVLIVGSTLNAPQNGIACFLGYLGSALLCDIVLGPQLRLEIAALRTACLLLSLVGLWIWDEFSVIESLARKLLLMELVSPFVHALWLTTKERELAILKPTLFFQAFTTLLLFFWYRVVVSAQVMLQIMYLLREHPRTELLLGFLLVAALSILQMFWFCRLCVAITAEHKKIA